MTSEKIKEKCVKLVNAGFVRDLSELKEEKLFLIKPSFLKKKDLMKEQDIFDKWLLDSQNVIYGSNDKLAKDTLLNDIDKLNCNWFNSNDIDTLVPKFTLKIFNELLKNSVELTPEEIENALTDWNVLKNIMLTIPTDKKIKLEDYLNDGLKNLLKKLKEFSEPCDTNLITHTEEVTEK